MCVWPNVPDFFMILVNPLIMRWKVLISRLAWISVRNIRNPPIVINTVASHHGDVEPESLIACIVQAADAISAARPGARRETLETYTNRLKQLEDITNEFKGVDKSFAIQAGREIRVMVVPEHVTDADMVLLARDIAKQIEAELEYPGQIKVNVIRESRAVDYAK